MFDWFTGNSALKFPLVLSFRPKWRNLLPLSASRRKCEQLEMPRLRST
jgi:hypothetical protein